MRARLIVQLPERLQLRLQRLAPTGGRPRQPTGGARAAGAAARAAGRGNASAGA